MNILLVGNGAREHAMAEAICKCDVALYSYMSKKNPGIARLSEQYFIGDICDAEKVASWAKSKDVELAIVGPEAPLEAGVVDALEKEGIDCASPSKTAARLETDKAYARDLMKKYDVPGAPIFAVLSTPEEVDEFVDSLSMDVVVKPAGLTGGKGVKIMGEHLEDRESVREYAKEIVSGDVGTMDKVVIEEKLVGEEFTLQAFVSPNEILGMPMVQDHKRAYEDDCGPNTGGMGSYTGPGYILPFLSEEDYEFGLDVIRKAIKALKDDTGVSYKGPIYGQFIATQNGLKLIEFNARFGDPEAMNVLTLFKGDFVSVMRAMVSGGLEDVDASFETKATVCKYLVPEGYPTNPASGEEITANEEAIEGVGAKLFYAAVDENNNHITTTSSRAAALVATGESIEKAEKTVERSVKFIRGPLVHRKDIGTEELIQRRFTHMRALRG